MTRILRPEPLTKAAFAPFGDVIETEGAQSFPINNGTTTRFHDLAKVDVGAEDGRPLISVFRAVPRELPMALELMERHPLGSQAFIALSDRPFLVVVGSFSGGIEDAELRAFLATPGQGVNYARNVWHHPLIAVAVPADFLVVDRGGRGENLEEVPFPAGSVVLEAATQPATA